MIEEESEKDSFELICGLPECFMMTWEEFMGMTSTVGYDIWSEDVIKTLNYPTSTNGGRHFKPQASYQMPIYGGRHFEPQSNNPIPTYGGRHFEPQSNYLTSTYRGDISNLKIPRPNKNCPHHKGGDISNPYIWRQTTR